MKFTLSWLKDHLETTASLQQISDTLTAIGLEVEQVIDRGTALKGFTVAKILHAEKHPEADKLRVCKVQSDIGELQIVCGAPNARTGLNAVLAKEGTVIPANGMVIKKTKIRGVESNGMLCSSEELALPGDSDGIIELPESAQVGEPVVKVLGLDDPVIEIAITPNRADCLGVHGIARDLAAAGLGTLKRSPISIGDSGKTPFASPIHVSIADPEKCRQFIGCYIKDIKNAASPDWLARRLAAIGQRPISVLVDITNYITFDLGRPLHVYDAKKLHGHIVVRDAKAGEKLLALNGKEYILQPGMTVIADECGALALGGIIGGEPSGCTEATTDVFLEVALFEPAQVAQTGRLLAIDSDARYRFERGVDPDFVETGAQIAVRMITELCGGKASELTITGKTPEWQRSYVLRKERIATLGGTPIPPAKMESILKSLGFTCIASTDGFIVSPPSWRHDIDGDADLIEEILRINGYDNIPPIPLPKLPFIGKPALNLEQKRAQLARHLLASRGMLEVYTWSFLSAAQATLFGGTHPQLQLLNPISADLDTMRPNLLPNLLQAAKKNAFRGFTDTALFEAGLQFHDTTPGGQRMVAAGLRTGHIAEHSYKDTLFKRHKRAVDAFDAKADALAMLQTLGLSKCDVAMHTPTWYHPGRSGALTLGGKIILGYFGEIHPAILSAFDIETNAVAFEIFLDAIPVPRAKGTTRPPLKLSDFQAVERDFAFIVDAEISAADISKAITQADKQLITNVEIFDVYTGIASTGTGKESKKSVAVKVTLQAMDRTLSEQDITAASDAIIAAAQKGFGGQLRQ